MSGFLLGVTAMGCVVVAMFFAQFWRETGDRFFALFAAAFAVFAVNRLVLSVLDEDAEARTVLYAVRLLAFLLIIGAIVDKNLKPGEESRPPPSGG